jgi:hypothetical protein
MYMHSQVARNRGVHAQFDIRQPLHNRLLRFFRFESQIDRRIVLSQVERDGEHAEVLRQNRRKQVLPGVLLHVVAPPRAVNLRLHLRSGQQRLLGAVPYRALLVLCHLVDRRQQLGARARVRRQRPNVIRLAAAGRVKRRPVERDLPYLTAVAPREFAYVRDSGAELQQ